MKPNLAYLNLDNLAKLYAEARNDRDEASKTWKPSGDLNHERIRARKYGLCELLSDFEKQLLHAKLDYDQNKDWKIPLCESSNILTRFKEDENGVRSLPQPDSVLDEKWMFFWPSMYSNILLSLYGQNIPFSISNLFDLSLKEKEQDIFEKLPLFIDKFERKIRKGYLATIVSDLEYSCRITANYTQLFREGLNKTKTFINYNLGHILFTVETHSEDETLISVIDYHYFKNPNLLHTTVMPNHSLNSLNQYSELNYERLDRINRKLDAYANIKRERKLISKKTEQSESDYFKQINDFVLNISKYYLINNLLQITEDNFDKKYALKIRDRQEECSQFENIIPLSEDTE